MNRMIKQGFLLVAAWTMCAAAVAGPITVDVGYADGLRGAGFFPSPWFGDAGIVFLGVSGPGADASAIKINNTSGGLITVDSVAVNVNGVAFAPGWTLPVSLLAGQSLILTETAHYNFDTSDGTGISGFGPGNLALGCDGIGTHASICPTVSIGVNGGAAALFRDSGHVLDTGGFDFASVGNESFAWRPIGTVGGPAGLIPEPGTLVLLGIAFAGLGLARRKLS